MPLILEAGRKGNPFGSCAAFTSGAAEALRPVLMGGQQGIETSRNHFVQENDPSSYSGPVIRLLRLRKPAQSHQSFKLCDVVWQQCGIVKQFLVAFVAE